MGGVCVKWDDCEPQLTCDKKDWFNPNATGICLGIRINLEKIKFFFISCSKLTYSNL